MTMGHNELPEIEAQIAEDCIAWAGHETAVEEIQIRIGGRLSAARAKFGEDDKGYGKWIREKLPAQVGQVKPDELRAWSWAHDHPDQLEQAKKLDGKHRTLRGLHDAWKKAYEEKPSTPPKAKPEKPRRITKEPADRDIRQQAAEAVIDGEVKSIEEAAEKFDLTYQVVRAEIPRVEGFREGLKEGAVNADEHMPATVKEHKAKLDRQFEKRVEIESQRKAQEWLAEHQLPLIHKRLDEIEGMLTRRRGVMSKKEYQTILKALHPDRGGDPEAFTIFRAAEIALTDGKSNPKPGGLDIGTMREKLKV